MPTTPAQKHERLGKLWGNEPYYPDEFAPSLKDNGLPSVGILGRMLTITNLWAKHHRALSNLWKEGGPLRTHCSNCKSGRLTEPAILSAIADIKKESGVASICNERVPLTPASNQSNGENPIRGSDQYLPTPDTKTFDLNDAPSLMTPSSDPTSFIILQFAPPSIAAPSQTPDRPSTIDDNIPEPVKGNEPVGADFWEMVGANCPDNPPGECLDLLLGGDTMASSSSDQNNLGSPTIVQDPTDSAVSVTDASPEGTTRLSITPSKLSSSPKTTVQPPPRVEVVDLTSAKDTTPVRLGTPARDSTPVILHLGKWLSQDDIHNCLQIHPRNPGWEVMYPGYPSLDQPTKALAEHRTLHASNLVLILFVGQDHWVVGHWAKATRTFTLYDSLRTEAHFDEVRTFMENWLAESDDEGQVAATFEQGDCPQQDDTDNCGIFAIGVAVALLTGAAIPTDTKPIVLRTHYADKLESPTSRAEPDFTDTKDTEGVATRNREGSIDNAGIDHLRSIKRSLPDVEAEATPSQTTKRSRSNPLATPPQPHPGQKYLNSYMSSRPNSAPSLPENPHNSRLRITKEAGDIVVALRKSLPEKQHQVSMLEMEIIEKKGEIKMLKEEIKQGLEDKKWFKSLYESEYDRLNKRSGC